MFAPSSSHLSPSSTLLQILLATNEDNFVPSITAVRSILINHVVKTHLETELDATSTTAMPETKEDFDIIALSLSTLVETIVPLLIQTSTTSPSAPSFTCSLITLCCAAGKKIPILLGGKGLFTKQNKKRAKHGQKVFNRALSSLSTHLLKYLKQVANVGTAATSTSTLLPALNFDLAMPLLLHGGSREYNRFFSYDWSGGWVSQGGKQHATTAAAALHAFQVLAKESRKSQSKTTCAIRLCTA